MALYNVNDVVKNVGNVYYCKLGHTGSVETEPGVGSSWQTYWDLMVISGTSGTSGDGFNNIGEWLTSDDDWNEPIKHFYLNDIVSWNWSVYCCIQEHDISTDTEPGAGIDSTAYWTLWITSGIDGSSGTSGSSGIDGTSGTSGTSGISGTDGSSGTSGSSGISGSDGSSGTSGIGFNVIGEWLTSEDDWNEPIKHFYVNDIVSHNWAVYSCIQEHDISTDTEPGSGIDSTSYWTLWITSGIDGTSGTSGGFNNRGDWLTSDDDWNEPVKHFYTNDIVTWNWAVYSCIQEHDISTDTEPGSGIDSTAYWTLWITSGIDGTNGSSYTHTQDSPSNTWTINHNFNNKYVIIACYNNEDEQIIPTIVKLNNANTATVTFSDSVIGHATVR